MAHIQYEWGLQDAYRLQLTVLGHMQINMTMLQLSYSVIQVDEL